MTGPIDFGSEEGFTQAAKKKKKAAASNWDEPEKDDSKKEEGDGNNGDAKDGDKATGDTGAGAGDDDKKDDTNGDGTKEADPADAWDSFLPAKGKKKGKKGAKIEEAIAAPDPPPAAEFDAFHEINLDTGPSLDLTFGDTSTKSSSFGSWGSSWNTGTTRYVWFFVISLVSNKTVLLWVFILWEEILYSIETHTDTHSTALGTFHLRRRPLRLPQIPKPQKQRAIRGVWIGRNRRRRINLASLLVL
jgi:hypothetical protein